MLDGLERQDTYKGWEVYVQQSTDSAELYECGVKHEDKVRHLKWDSSKAPKVLIKDMKRVVKLLNMKNTDDWEEREVNEFFKGSPV